MLFDVNTVRPALVTTCLKRPYFLLPLKRILNETVLKEPVYEDHFLCSLLVVAIDRFDCMFMIIQGPMEDHYLLVNGLPWQKIRNK